MEINPSEVTKILKEQIKKFGDKAEITEVGQVLSVGDGIARVYGLDNAFADFNSALSSPLFLEQISIKLSRIRLIKKKRLF